MKKSKITALALSFAFAATALTGCGGSKESAGGTVTTDGSTSMEEVDRKSTRLNSSHP